MPTPTDAAPAPVRVGVLVFPGSNDAPDLSEAFERLGAQVAMVWHKDVRLPEGLAGLGVPGGFSYGDYLRAGAMARFSPVMPALEDHARAGRPVIGICNGFQILCEAGLLPGALVRNRDLRFLCCDVSVEVADLGGLAGDLDAGEELRLPIKHGQGAYVSDPAHPARVALRYRHANPNGSSDDIAGIVNTAGNVLGLMPHPEHAVDPLLGAPASGGRGSTDGERLLRSFLGMCGARAAA